MGDVQSLLSYIAKLVLKITGQLSSGQRDPKPPPGVKKLNDHVWEFCRPTKYDVEIIFFHGLQMGDFEDAFWKTWRARDNDKVLWPKDWLSKRLPNARILSVSYNSGAMKGDGQLSIVQLGENLVSDIIECQEANIGRQNRPVFLVGHSLGGIVIKQFIISALQKRDKLRWDNDRESIYRTFLGNLKGVYYYATPHRGSKIADLVADLPNTSDILSLLRTLNTDAQRINEEFSDHQRNLGLKSRAVAESLPTVLRVCGIVLFKAVIVPQESAIYDVQNSYIDTNADHITVCKATRNDRAVMDKLTDFITGAESKIEHNSEVDIYSMGPASTSCTTL